MAEQDLLRLARESIETFNRGDWQQYRDLHAQDAVYNEPATQRRVQGADQIVEIDRSWREAFPDARGTITKTFCSGDTCVLEITWEGTQRGPLEGPTGTLPPSGKRARIQACQVMTFRNNKIQEVHHYFDLMGMLQQLGAFPMPPSMERPGEYPTVS